MVPYTEVARENRYAFLVEIVKAENKYQLRVAVAVESTS